MIYSFILEDFVINYLYLINILYNNVSKYNNLNTALIVNYKKCTVTIFKKKY